MVPVLHHHPQNWKNDSYSRRENEIGIQKKNFVKRKEKKGKSGKGAEKIREAVED